MNTKMMEQFEIMDTDMLAKVEGGFGGWGDMLSGLLGGLARCLGNWSSNS